MGKQTEKIDNHSALILLSGGQDSTTCLAWTKKKFKEVVGITFDYGQLHKIEISSAKKIAKLTKTPLKIYKISLFKDFTKNALTDSSVKINAGGKNSLPSTFVDGRNHIFLSIAAIYAKQLNIHNIVTGVCQTDYSGYPDCRDNFIKLLEKTLTLAMDYKFKIHTPLMWLTKAKTVELAKKLKTINLLKYTHTCYKGSRPACGKCPACKLRLKGFKEAGIKDPIKYKI
ncbi:7-cyano-7-deazaguanine synthase QueC [Candidatus Peregrinibacteria bacterium]|nr:7-cyano-7-deazaguanine synthase QueC [Candidatus Peregrinibacteria bacterium]